MELWLGTKVRCADEVIGELVDVAIDPASRRLTHVVVQSPDELAWLVPWALVAGERHEVTLSCTVDELHAFGSIREVAYMRLEDVPAGDDDTDVGVQNMTSMPLYEPTTFGEYTGELDSWVTVSYDRIPKGEAELRRSSDVLLRNGHRLGRLRACVVADGDGGVTHIVLVRGYLWSKRDVTVPIGAVSSIATDAVTLALARDEADALPSKRVLR